MDLSDEEDPIDAFFRGKIVKNARVVQPSFNIVRKSEKTSDRFVKREFKDEKKIEKTAEERKLLTEFLNAPIEEIDNTLGIDESNEVQDCSNSNQQVYKKYEFNIPKQDLPILSQHDLILQTIRANKITIIKADTGCGKSSQIPQYILEDCCSRNEPCNIIITQPKKISAESLATRVSLERKCQIGSLVGYQIGLERKMDPVDTRILYCTTGVLLQKLVHFKSLQKWTHIIIDEIHERDLNMDLVLLIIRRLVVATKSKAKIILMSATLDCDKISDYFKIIQKPPIVELKVKKPFPIMVHYLDDLKHLGPSRDFINLDEPGINNSMFKLGATMIDFFTQKGAESFLVFLPGIFEIECFYRELQFKRETFNVQDYNVFILHSSIPLENVRFLYDSSLKKKIVLATNIAESSITIPNIQIIIDYCLAKLLEIDSGSGLTQLKLSWASKMNMEQRAGRTGRTCRGQIIRMLFKDQYGMLPDSEKPEMQRTSLANVILKVKNLQMGKPSDILAISLDPPKRIAIVDAILMLKENCAMTRFSMKSLEFDFLDGNLTFAGVVMSKLPLDIRLSKLIILGNVFSVLRECIIIAACLSVGSIFQYQNNMKSFDIKFNNDCTSDLIAMLNAYNKYIDFHKFKKQNVKDKSLNEEKWCRNHLLNFKNIKEVSKLIEDIKKRVKEFSFCHDDFRYTTEEKLCVIKICIAGAFYPNFYTFGGEIPGRDEFKQVFNKDLCSTVYFQTRKSTKNGHLYEEQLQDVLYDNEIIDISDDARITFDSNSQKIFVHFENMRNDNNIKVPGDVKIEVYRSIKFQSLKRANNDLKIYLMSPENEEIYAPSEERHDFYSSKNISAELKQKASQNIFPSLSLNTKEKGQFLYGEITHIISPSKFYFQPKKAINLREKLNKIIGSNLQKIDHIEEVIEKNKIMVLHDNQFKRGQILEFPDANERIYIYKVLLIDFGELIECRIEDFYTGCAINRVKRQDILRDFFKIPFLCYECKLAEIKPTALQQFGWNQNAILHFKESVRDKIIQLELYAFNTYDKIASVVVFARTSPTAPFFNINYQLVSRGLAVQTNESYVAMISQTCDKSQAMKYEMHNEIKAVNYPKELLEVPCSLLGVFTPLQATGRLQSITRSTEKNIFIDNSSVNCALVDPYPSDGIKKVLVSSAKSMTSRGNITVQSSTLMPFINGIEIILALIFSPFAEIRCDEKKTRFTSILTGLGCDFMLKPYYAEHDCFLRTNVELDDEDIAWINSLRNEISTLMQQNIDSNFDFQLHPLNVINQARKRSCSLLLNILHKERLQLGEKYVDEFDWSEFTTKKCTEPLKMFPRHSACKLQEIPPESVKKMINHFRNLEQKSRFNSKDEIVDCFACDERIETITDLKNHILKIKHVKLKEKFELLSRNNPSTSRKPYS